MSNIVAQTIEVEILYNENDVKKAISFYLLHVCNLFKYAVVVYPILIISTILSLTYSRYNLLSVVFIFIGGFIYNKYYLNHIEDCIKFYKKIAQKTFKFCDEKVYSYGNGYKSEFLWSMLKYAYELPTAFILIDSNISFYIIPKSAFKDTSSIEQLRNLLCLKIEGFKTYKK